jgi:hypothetical protein
MKSTNAMEFSLAAYWCNFNDHGSVRKRVQQQEEQGILGTPDRSWKVQFQGHP